MGAIRKASGVKLIASILSADESLFDEVSRRLERMFGPIDFTSNILDFTHTDYYSGQMGPRLKRIIVAFGRPVDPAISYRTKISTNRLEKRYESNGKRRVNIDPGFLTHAKLVLYSTKDHSHRIYIAGGIFAELTLYYRGGRYNPWPWTYPDYASSEYADIFGEIRARIK